MHKYTQKFQKHFPVMGNVAVTNIYIHLIYKIDWDLEMLELVWLSSAWCHW